MGRQVPGRAPTGLRPPTGGVVGLLCKTTKSGILRHCQRKGKLAQAGSIIFLSILWI